MRSDTQQASRRRRGGRRHRNPRGSSSSSSYSSVESSPVSRKPVKLGFFQRILAFFKGKPKGPDRAYGRVIDRPTPAAKSPATVSNGRKIQFDSPAQSAHPAQSPKVARRPELVEVSSPKLYVGNLSFDAGESDLSELFAGVGSVQSAEVVSHRETQKSKGFAFITMSSTDEARRAVAELHDKEFMGRRLVVSGAKTNDVRDVR